MTYFDILLLVLFVVLIIRLIRERRSLNAEETKEHVPASGGNTPYDRRKLNTASILLCIYMLAIEIISCFVRSFALAALVLAIAGFVIYLVYLKKCASPKPDREQKN